MKNYELKYATKELNDAKIVTVKLTNKRLAYLVSNMFNKMKNGFAKKINPIIVVYQEEQSKVVNEEVKPEPAPAEVPKVESQPAPSVVDDSKNYIIKAYLADIEALSRNKKALIQAPKKLLISKLFVQKLIANRMKNIETLNKKTSNPEETKQTSFVNAQEEAVYKYISLNDEMKDLIKQIEDKKAQMVSLAKEHGLTRTMVENAIAKRV